MARRKGQTAEDSLVVQHRKLVIHLKRNFGLLILPAHLRAGLFFLCIRVWLDDRCNGTLVDQETVRGAQDHCLVAVRYLLEEDLRDRRVLSVL